MRYSRALRPKGPLDRPKEIEGASLEGLVAQHLRAWLAYSDQEATLFYWRTRSGVEVDFVIYGGAGFWAIEVKNTARVRPEDLGGLKSFAADYPECRTLLLYRGLERVRTDNLLCIPVEEFLRGSHPNRDLIEDHPRLAWDEETRCSQWLCAAQPGSPSFMPPHFSRPALRKDSAAAAGASSSLPIAP